MKYLISMFVISLLVLLSSCSMLPERPDSGRSGVGRVGYFVDAESNPMHTDTGASVDKSRVVDESILWPVKERIAAAIKKNIEEKTKFSLVDLSSIGFNKDDLADIVRLQDGKFVTDQEKLGTLERLKNELQVDYVILVTRATTQAIIYCDGFGYCESIRGVGTGLITKRGILIDEYRGVLGSKFDIYSLNPASNLALYSPTQAPNIQFPLGGFSRQDANAPLSASEWSLVEMEVLRAADDLGSRAVNSLLDRDIVCKATKMQSTNTSSKMQKSGPTMGCSADVAVEK